MTSAYIWNNFLKKKKEFLLIIETILLKENKSF